jgi:hypothetical protein
MSKANSLKQEAQTTKLPALNQAKYTPSNSASLKSKGKFSSCSNVMPPQQAQTDREKSGLGLD